MKLQNKKIAYLLDTINLKVVKAEVVTNKNSFPNEKEFELFGHFTFLGEDCKTRRIGGCCAIVEMSIKETPNRWTIVTSSEFGGESLDVYKTFKDAQKDLHIIVEERKKFLKRELDKLNI